MHAKQDYLDVENAVSKGETRRSISPFQKLFCMARTRVFECYVGLVSISLGFVIAGYLAWVHNPKAVRVVLRFWCRSFLLGARVILGIRSRIEGLENIPSCPVIFAGNHQSCWESIAMAALIPDINIVTKRSAMSIPVFGWGLRHAPMTPIDRETPGKNIRRMVREGRDSIADGRSMLIFPEGTRLPPGEQRPFARGVELLYRGCSAPMVPFVTNAGMCWPNGFATKYPGEITLRFLPPLQAGKAPHEIANQIETILNEEKARLIMT